MAVRVMRLAPQEMCKASYECAKAGPLGRRVVLVMTQIAALFALAPATITLRHPEGVNLAIVGSRRPRGGYLGGRREARFGRKQ